MFARVLVILFAFVVIAVGAGENASLVAFKFKSSEEHRH